MTTAKKTASTVPATEEVINIALKNGNIVPSQVKTEEVHVITNVENPVSVVSIEGSILEVEGNKYRFELVTDTTVDEDGRYFSSSDGVEYVLVPIEEEVGSVKKFFGKTKTLLGNKKFYVSAGATVAALVIGTVVIALTSKKTEDENGENDNDTQSDQEVEDTDSV